MPKRIFVLSVMFLALAIFPATRSAAKPNAGDTLVDSFFSAIRDGKFDAATRHFSARMKAFSPAGLKGSWDQVYAQEGPLLSWKIFARQKFTKGRDEISVQLRFHRATADSIIVVTSQTGEITSVLFKQPVTSPPLANGSATTTVGSAPVPRAAN